MLRSPAGKKAGHKRRVSLLLNLAGVSYGFVGIQRKRGRHDGGQDYVDGSSFQCGREGFAPRAADAARYARARKNESKKC